MERYFHGYAPEERRRLVRQAEYWRRTLIPLGLDYRPGDRVLEVGCGAGATLAVLARDFAGIRAAGIDLEPGQIEFARRHFAALGLPPPDLRLGDARALPWEDASIDHVYIMWVLEHLRDSLPILREAHRVLRPGGSIAVTETDYTTFKVLPPSPDWDYVERAQHDFFARHGNAIAGREMGLLLGRAGFTAVRNAPAGFHFFQGGEDGRGDADGLRRHVEYVAEFLEPGIPGMVAEGADEERLRRGVAHLRAVAAHPGGSLTTIVYRAHARKAGGER